VAAFWAAFVFWGLFTSGLFIFGPHQHPPFRACNIFEHPAWQNLSHSVTGLYGTGIKIPYW
jgi:hypothetical protein